MDAMTDTNLEPLHARIDTAAGDIAEDVIAWRHHLHRHPELSNREEKTAEFIAQRLREFGIEDITTGVGGHGVVARIHGGAHQGRVVLLRADIDALPVHEDSGEEFASEVDGVAHACGHDTHAAMLLGAAKILQDMRGELGGDVLLAFQPAEEGAPEGEEGGARVMVRDMEAKGLLTPAPTMAFGIHIAPLPVGALAYARGIQNAASETVKITVTGKQVHGSTPWQGIDPMPAVGDILSNIGQIYRQIDPQERFSITLGHIEDQGRFNIVGNQVVIWGTVRSLTSAVVSDINARLSRYVEHLAAAHGCTGTVEFLDEVPPVVNAPEWVDAVLPIYEHIAGDKPVIEIPPSMGYDDVSEFTSRFGGVFALLGGQNFTFTADGGIDADDPRGFAANHSPQFYVNDDALAYGVRLHAQVAVDHLGGVAAVTEP